MDPFLKKEESNGPIVGAGREEWTHCWRRVMGPLLKG
jgi:hypothetical protein